MTNTGKEPPKSKLNYLNGGNYDANPNVSVGGLPLNMKFNAKNRKSKIIETVFVKEGLIHAPINHEKLVLKNSDNKVVAKIHSGAAGTFEFFTVLKNGNYSLEIDSKKYQGRIQFELTSYELTDLKLVVKERSN